MSASTHGFTSETGSSSAAAGAAAPPSTAAAIASADAARVRYVFTALSLVLVSPALPFNRVAAPPIGPR